MNGFRPRAAARASPGPSMGKSEPVGKNERTASWRIGRLLTGGAIGLIRVYQMSLGRCLGPTCRFYPSCSEYMIQSMRRYGFARGLGRGLKRIGRCHPWHPGGYDPP
ncbi:MAG: hypothetical protein KatS3mg108_2769 [Isosphaeraceae bacterium]|nr:MAG: hypothetical protein KatS3mg108_2769 [Isosphaeraceae bacterium]